jgi:hypothetical protein
MQIIIRFLCAVHKKSLCFFVTLVNSKNGLCVAHVYVCNCLGGVVAMYGPCQTLIFINTIDLVFYDVH